MLQWTDRNPIGFRAHLNNNGHATMAQVTKVANLLLLQYQIHFQYNTKTMLKCVHENVISESVQLILSHPSQNRLTAIILFKRCVHVSHYMDPIVSHSYTGYIFNNTLLLYHFYKLRLSHQNFFGAYNVKICGQSIAGHFYSLRITVFILFKTFFKFFTN